MGYVLCAGHSPETLTATSKLHGALGSWILAQTLQIAITSGSRKEGSMR